MNIKLNLIFLLIIVQTSWAQHCDFEIRVLSSQLNGETEIIDKLQYEKANQISMDFIEFEPTSELFLTKKHPEIFKLKDSCYIFTANTNYGIGIKTPELKACKNSVQSKEYSNYEFKGTYCDNALIEVQGHEHWGFLSVDLESGLTCFTMGKPLTSNGETAISYSNYYGEEEIALTELNTKKQYVIGIENWKTIESKIIENSHYLKLESEYSTQCKKENKYLWIKIKN